MSERLPVAETFYSVQGEGRFSGVPAVFLRSSHCNLRCPGWGPRDAPQGYDTTEVWTKVWRRMSAQQISDYWRDQGWLGPLSSPGSAHLVLTGGEPLLWQKALLELLEHLAGLAILPFVEVETNGTLVPTHPLDARVGQYNCSPKLMSAGNRHEKAVLPEVLNWFASNPRTVFKFVVQVPADLDEIQRDYVAPLQLNGDRVWLMPEAATRARLIEQSEWVVEACKERGFNFTSRLQLLVWDKATGV